MTAPEQARDPGPRGLGEFQRRSNRNRNWVDSRGGRSWDATPQARGNWYRGEESLSVRIPNTGWEATPRQIDERDVSDSSVNMHNRRWDAPTPRIARDGSPDNDVFGLDVREWEEEQVRLDRDWYTGAEEGGLAGDEEHNPLSTYSDLEQLKQAEIATKQVKRKISAKQAQYVRIVFNWMNIR